LTNLVKILTYLDKTFIDNQPFMTVSFLIVRDILKKGTKNFWQIWPGCGWFDRDWYSRWGTIHRTSMVAWLGNCKSATEWHQ